MTQVPSTVSAVTFIPPSPANVTGAAAQVESIAREESALYGADFGRLWATVECEDPTLDPDQQSLVPDPDGPGGRENSWGLTQIDLDYNPGITKAQAEDPRYSLELMAQNFAAGHEGLYHCYKHLYPEE